MSPAAGALEGASQLRVGFWKRREGNAPSPVATAVSSARRKTHTDSAIPTAGAWDGMHRHRRRERGSRKMVCGGIPTDVRAPSPQRRPSYEPSGSCSALSKTSHEPLRPWLMVSPPLRGTTPTSLSPWRANSSSVSTSSSRCKTKTTRFSLVSSSMDSRRSSSAPTASASSRSRSAASAQSRLRLASASAWRAESRLRQSSMCSSIRFSIRSMAEPLCSPIAILLFPYARVLPNCTPISPVVPAVSRAVCERSPWRDLRSTLLCSFFFAPDHEHGTVGVADHRIGDASDERPSDTAQSPASHYRQAGPQVLCQLYDLRVWPADGHVRILDLASMLLQPSDLLVEERPDIVLGLFPDRLFQFSGVEVMTVEVFGRRHHEHHVQPRAGGDRYLRRRLCCDPGLLRPVDGEQDRTGKFTAFSPHHEDRAGGMVDHGEGDAAHHGTPDGTHPPAAENHEPRPNLFGDAYDLRVRTASYSVNRGDLQVHLFHLFDLAFQQLAGRNLRPLADVPPELRRHYPRLWPGERVGHGLHRDQV